MSDKICNLEETIAMARKAVEERGEDWVYPKEGQEWRFEGPGDDWNGACRYALADDSDEPKPACIVGHVLHQVGVLEDFADSQRSSAALDIPFTREAAHFLNLAQIDQDSGYSWGESVRHAIAAVGK